MTGDAINGDPAIPYLDPIVDGLRTFTVRNGSSLDFSNTSAVHRGRITAPAALA